MTLLEEFAAVVLDGAEPRRRHRISPSWPGPFTLCDEGGWCTEDADAVTCPDCKAIQEGRAERIPWEFCR